MSMHVVKRFLNRGENLHENTNWRNEEITFTFDGRTYAEPIFYPVVGGAVNKNSWLTKVSNSCHVC